MEEVNMFSKEERSSFRYWFAHWCAFQMTALNNDCWRFKYLFHDIWKPWIKLILRDYKKVQKLHRKFSRHHLEYYLKHKKADFYSMMLDWECSRFTKESSPRTATQELEKVCKRFVDKKELTKSEYKDFLFNCNTALIGTNIISSDLVGYVKLYDELKHLGENNLQ